MRALARNKVTFYYAPYAGKLPIRDEYGNLTGEHEVVYELPVKAVANISAARGETQTRQFGESEGYDKVIVMDKYAPPIDEHSILWVDTMPEFGGDGYPVTPHDYVVKKVARSLNGVSIAIEKVTVS